MTAAMRVWVPLSIVLTLSGVWAHPSGAPSYSCGIYVPNHKVYPQPPDTNPFVILASSHNYNISDGEGRIEVNITTKSGKLDFKGFVLASYDEYGQPFGTFLKSDIAHQIHQCKAPAVTHNNSHNKKLVTLYWKPPAEGAPPTGIVNFRATVVSCYQRFWVEIPSTVQDEDRDLDQKN